MASLEKNIKMQKFTSFATNLITVSIIQKMADVSSLII